MPQSRAPPAGGGSDPRDPGVEPAPEPPFESEWNPFEGVPAGAAADGGTAAAPAGTPAVELDGLRRTFDSEYERALQDQEISWRARYGATRQSFAASALLMMAYLWLGCLFYRREADWSVPDALLFTVYTVTTVGYGGPQPLPNTASFHAFTSVYLVVGISLVTVLAAHTYQLVTLEATRIRSSSSAWGRPRGTAADPPAFGQEALTREIDRYRQQFTTELEDLARAQPRLDAALVRIRGCRRWLRATRCGRATRVALPLLGNVLLGAVVVGLLEGWSPLEAAYWSVVTLTTVGYGDYTPTRTSSVLFCTLFFLPSSLFFLSFLLAHVARGYIRLHAVHVARLEGQMRRRSARDAARANDAAAPGAPPPTSPSPGAKEDVERGFTTVLSYTEGDDGDHGPHKGSGLFGDQSGLPCGERDGDPLAADTSPALRYRAHVIRDKETAPDRRGHRAVTFAEALRSLDDPRGGGPARPRRGSDDRGAPADPGAGRARPALELRLRVQARLARIIAEEVAGHQTGVLIQGATVSLTVGGLRDTSEKWKVPPRAWKAFRAVAFRSLLFVGERDLIADGGDALLRLNVVEFHRIFSPMLAAMGDGGAMEAWLAATDILADVELRGGARYGSGKPIFTATFT